MKTLKNEVMAEKELNSVLLAAKKRGVTQDGVWVRDQLKSLGWCSEYEQSFSEFNDFSEKFYFCGYSGNRNQAKMRKGL